MSSTPEPKEEDLPEDEQPGDGEDLCPACLTPHGPLAHFCGRCGAPVSALAPMMPFEKIFAEGYVYRHATESPGKFIVVAGIWLIFLPMAIQGALMLNAIEWETFKDWKEPGFAFFNILGLVVPLGLVGVSTVIIARTTWAYFRQRSGPSDVEREEVT